MSIRTILIASILASLGATAGQERAAVAQPVLPPPPAPMYQPQPEPEPAYPPAPSYTPQQQPAPTHPLPAQQQPHGYPPPQQPQGYPPPAQPAPGYPQQQPEPGHPQQQPEPGYPQQQPEPGYPQQPATGYPQPGQSYPPPPPGQPPPPQGYPAPPPQGYPAPQPQGYPAPPPQGQPPPPGQPAQTQGYPPPPQDYPAPQQDYPAPAPPEPEAESVFANPLSKLQVGFHLGTGSLTADNRTYDSDLTSLGIFARYRFNQRWEAELAIAQDSGTVKANNATREFQPITASALWHVFDLSGVDVYARLGLGRATESYRNPAFRPLEGPTTHIHVGAGASYIFRGNIGAGVEMRWQSIRRGSTDEISPLNASGTTYNLFGAYHF